MALPRWMSPSARRVLALMVFWGQIQNYMMRVNLSILIVAMVKDPLPTVSSSNGSDTSVADVVDADVCPVDVAALNVFNASETTSKGNADRDDEVLFEWDSVTRGIILSSFSYGYVTTQIIGGRLTEKFGVKKVYGFCLLSTAILTFLSPVAAKLHVYAFMAVRALQGVFEGVTFPALQAMTARWIPLEERTSFIARCFFGTTFGLVFTFPMCGALVAYSGWESAFYVIGCITLIWFAFWWMLVFDTPETHPRISKSEKDLIEASLAGNVDLKKSIPVPWKKIMTSWPFLGLMATDIGNSWGIIVLGSQGPTYLKYMLGVDIKTNGIVSGLPMLSRYLGGVFHALIADWLQKRKLISVIWTRRIFNSVSQIAPAIAMMMLVFSPTDDLRCSVSYAISLLCVGMFFNGAISSGHFSSFVDLAPNFAGTLMGITNTGGSIMGFVVPVLVGAITANMNFTSWKVVFSLAAGIYTICNFIYVFMIDGKPQEWNFPENNLEMEENNEKLILAPKVEHEEADKDLEK